MSYVNVILYGAVLPSYTGKKGKDKGSQKHTVIKADNPANKEAVRHFFDSID